MFHVKHPAVLYQWTGMCPVRPQGIRNPRSLVGAGLRPRPVGGDGGFVGADPCVGPRADPAKSVSGRTHRSAPTRWGRRSEPTENWCEDGALSAGRDGARPLQGERSRLMRPGRRGEVTPPYGCNAGGAQRRADVPKAWLPPAKFCAEIWGVSHGYPALRVQRWWCAAAGRCGHRPLRIEGEAVSTTRASGAQRSVCGAVARDG